MIDPDKYIFLLGGHDLEMEEIGKILLSRGLKYYDLNLEWGAKLSAYSAFFDDKHTFVGIELIKDAEPPKKYREIDHHNERSGMPASIVQVAALLDIELDRRQQLIAANDRGYISGMLALGASKEEVKEIREADRRAQGVTDIDEQQAEAAIASGVTLGDLLVVYYEGLRFSPVTDRVHSKQLMVWNYKTLNYYGSETALLKEHFQSLVSEGKAYFGGKPLSFFGLVPNCFDKAQIEKLKDEIIRLVIKQ